MKIAVVGAGAVGGYYAARLALAGHDVAVVARGAHLAAIANDGLRIRTAAGETTARVRASTDPRDLGEAELVLFAVKTYDNPTALPLLEPLTGAATIVLTLQNGVDSAAEVAGVVGEPRVLAGAAYIATAIAGPGLIEQTGTHDRIVLGEVFGDRSVVSGRVASIGAALERAGIEVNVHADVRAPLWEKFIYLAPFAGITGAARRPIGPLRARAGTLALFDRACGEVEALARAEGIPVAADVRARIRHYVDVLPPTTRSSLLIDLQAGKRIEVEALQGSVVRRAHAAGIDVPVMETLYAVLREQP